MRRTSSVLLGLVAAGCALDTSPAGGTAEDTAPITGSRPDVIAPPATAGGGAGDSAHAPPTDGPGGRSSTDAADAGAMPDPEQPATSGSDASLADAPGNDPEQDPGVDAEDPSQDGPADEPPPADDAADDEGSLIDWVSDLARFNPRVREARALQRIAAAMTAGASPSTIIEALDALGQLGCYSNQETCARVCQWALLNCGACAGEAACMDAISSSCVIGCSR